MVAPGLTSTLIGIAMVVPVLLRHVAGLKQRAAGGGVTQRSARSNQDRARGP